MASIDHYREFVAENEAEAVEKAAAHYGVPPEQLEIRVVPPELSVAGLGTRTLILASLKGEGRARRGPDGGARRRPAREPGRRERRPAERPAPPPEPEPKGPAQIEAGELGPVGEFVRGILERLAKAGRVRIDEVEIGGEALIELSGDGVSALAAREPGLPAALSHLAQRAAQALVDEEASARVELPDLAPPSDPRLEELARGGADEVQRTGEPKLLEPMNSRDRYIVHNVIKELPGVTSESVGEGRTKRVKIIRA